jgi:hypothetical protein
MYMKAKVFIAAMAALVVISSFRPVMRGGFDKSGLYLTPDDFLKNQLSYADDASQGTERRIKIHDGLFGSATVDLVYNGKKQVFSLAQVYGYRDAKGRNYRFFGKQAYRIEDTTGFYLYSCNKLVRGEKISRPTNLYYFSVSPGGDVQLLTRSNLENAYPQNTRFRYSIEALIGPFGSDASLVAYDAVLKTFKIKYYYTQSLQ